MDLVRGWGVFALVVVCLWAGGAVADEPPAIAPVPAPVPAPGPAPGPAPAAPFGETRVETRAHAVVGLGADGVERWRIAHPGMDAKDPEARPLGPVTVAGRTIYAIAADVLELDVAAGQAIARTRFPAPITALAPDPAAPPGEARFVVTVTIRQPDFPPHAPPDVVPLRWRLGDPSPGRAAWGTMVPWLRAPHEATLVVPGMPDKFDADLTPLTPAQREAGIAALLAAEARNLTNPYLPALRGRLLGAMGRTDEAAQAYAKAADLPAACWMDLLRLSNHLENLEQRGPGQRAFTRGLAAMQAAGLRPERLYSLVSLMVLYGRPEKALPAAIAAGDVERVHELASRTWQFAPHVEAGRKAWRSLARWMHEHGRADLAKQWDERAAAARYDWLETTKRGARIDQWLPLAKGFLLACPFIALAIGLRAGARRRRGATSFAWLPRPRIVDAVSMAVPLLGALYGTMLVADNMTVIGRQASAPIALMDDGLAAPEVERWVAAKLSPSPARDRVLAYVRDEAVAARAGGRASSEPPPQTVMMAAVAARPLGDSLRDALRLEPRDLMALQEEADFAIFSSLRRAASWALLLFAAGCALGAWRSRLANFADYLPGGATLLGPAGGLVAAGITCGYVVLRHTPLLGSLGPGFAKYFALESIAQASTAPPSSSWGWLLLGVAVAAQVTARAVESMRSRTAAK